MTLDLLQEPHDGVVGGVGFLLTAKDSVNHDRLRCSWNLDVARRKTTSKVYALQVRVAPTYLLRLGSGRPKPGAVATADLS